MLLLVDSVNVLLHVITRLLSGDFDVLSDPIKIRYLKIMTVFTLGSAFGLVSISHVLGYVLKRWNQIVNALIIGFITGSLGIVWPWKKVLYLQEKGNYLIDKKGNKIVENYERFVPDFSNSETWFGVFYIIIGVLLSFSDRLLWKKEKIKFLGC